MSNASAECKVKYKVGDILRHRVFGSTILVKYIHEPPDDDSPRMVSCDISLRQSTCYQDVELAGEFNIIGHISDARWDAKESSEERDKVPPATGRAPFTKTVRGTVKEVQAILNTPLDPATPRRFRWKNSDGQASGYGCAMQWDGKWRFFFNCDDGHKMPLVTPITDWLDPKPENLNA